LRIGGRERTVVQAPTYLDIGAGQIGLVVDSYGLVSIAADRASAAEALGITAGSQVALVPVTDNAADDERQPSSTPIRITPRTGS
jgi:S-adenosylmethionine hydrolase